MNVNIFEMESDQEQLQPRENVKKGLNIFVAAVFILGTMCGSGILALPKALVDSGWFGIPLLIICGLLSSYTGKILGECWTVLRKRYPEYETNYISDPYPTIGFRAAGKWGKLATRIAIVATLFGGATVYLLLISENISTLLKAVDVHMYACYWILIIAAVLTPLTWLGTPKDFWQAGILAAITSAIGAVLIVAGLATMTVKDPVTHSNPSFDSFFTAFGTILFGFGGASCFPTIQVDMKNPEKFGQAVVIGIFSVMTLYLLVSVSGFVVLGDTMTNSNILQEMDGNWIQYAVIILITSHLFMAYLIVVNPIMQDVEGFFKLEDKFSIKRCLVRSGVMVLILFVGLSVPHFGVILSLVGGTTVAASNFVFPPLFYLLLARQKKPLDAYGNLPIGYTQHASYKAGQSVDQDYSDGQESQNSEPVVKTNYVWTQIKIPLYIKIFLVEIISIGVVGGIASTYSVIKSLADGSSGFTVPCYVNMNAADN